MNNNELSVLTLNCWGLWLISKKREFRLRAIADVISAQDGYDIVTLQELWVQEDFEYLKQQTQEMLPHAKYFYSGAFGSGLAILSRYPIVSTGYTRYTLAGRPLKIFHGDFYVGKGIASASIEHPDIGIVDVFTTHLHAGYGDKTEYEGHRLSESWELAHRVRASAAQGRHVILTGDFNSVPTSHNYRLLQRHAYMTDAWLQANKDSSQTNHHDTGNEEDMIQAGGITCNSPLNSWAKKKDDNFLGDRLDYIFYKATPQLQCLKSRVVMTEKISGTSLSYSDHFGVHATFGLYPDAPATMAAACMPGRDENDEDLSNPTRTDLAPDILGEIKDVFTRDQEATRRTANLLLALFILSLALIMILYACLIAVPATVGQTRNGLTSLLITLFVGLAAIMVTAFGTISFIVGFVFGHTEQRALAQFVSDVDTLLDNINTRTSSSSSSPAAAAVAAAARRRVVPSPLLPVETV